MSFSPSLSLYRVFGNQVAAGNTADGLVPKELVARPKGQLIWLHSPIQENQAVTWDFLNRLADENPDCWFLLTSEGAQFQNLPGQTLFQVIESDRPRHVKAFLDHWAPDLSIWLTDHLLPTVIHETKDRGIPLVLLDNGAAVKTAKGAWYYPGLARRTLRKFDSILSGDEATSLALISAGARRDNVQTTGALELTVSPPSCNQEEWDMLSKLLATRPVWLATQLGIQDLASVLAAHTQATHRSHRLLLIISPADLKDAPAMIEALEKSPFAFSVRSEAEEPDPDIQIYLADTEQETGLWYRLAPVSFIGQAADLTLNKEANPLEAAALGSVVLHGPVSGRYEIAYQRLERAGASRSIAHLGELAHVLETVLAPDRAAVMAHAGWQVTSSGARAMQAAEQAVADFLGHGKDTDP